MGFLKLTKIDFILLVLAVIYSYWLNRDDFFNSGTSAEGVAAILGFLISIVIFMVVAKIVVWIVRKVLKK